MRSVGVQDLTSSRLCVGRGCAREVSGREALCDECRQLEARRQMPLSPSDVLGFEPEAVSPLTPAAWRASVQRIGRLRSAANWALGDLLAYSSIELNVKVKLAAEELGLPERTLRVVEWTARSVARTQRVKQLTWSHHVEVGWLPAKAQSEWLQRALEQDWSSEAPARGAASPARAAERQADGRD